MVSIEKKFGYPPETFYVSSGNFLCILRKPFLYPPETISVPSGNRLYILRNLSEYFQYGHEIPYTDFRHFSCGFLLSPMQNSIRFSILFRPSFAGCRRFMQSPRTAPLESAALSVENLGTFPFKVRNFRHQSAALFPLVLAPFPPYLKSIRAHRRERSGKPLRFLQILTKHSAVFPLFFRVRYAAGEHSAPKVQWFVLRWSVRRFCTDDL